MGNSASAEAPRKSLKANNKLSKPKIGNHANTGLLGSNGFSESKRRSSRTEVLPRRPDITPLPSPMHAPSEVESGSSDAAAGFPGFEAQDHPIRPSFLRADSSQSQFQEKFVRHDRRGSTGTVASRQATRLPVRANSMIVGTPDWRSYENMQAA